MAIGGIFPFSKGCISLLVTIGQIVRFLINIFLRRKLVLVGYPVTGIDAQSGKEHGTDIIELFDIDGIVEVLFKFFQVFYALGIPHEKFLFKTGRKV